MVLPVDSEGRAALVHTRPCDLLDVEYPPDQRADGQGRQTVPAVSAEHQPASGETPDVSSLVGARITVAQGGGVGRAQ